MKRDRKRGIPVLCGALAVLLAAGLTAGCADDDPVEPEPKPAPLALSEDQLVTMVQHAYRDMDLADYRALLHEDYRFYFLQSDITNLGLPFDHLTRAEEDSVAAHMFSGRPAPNTGEAAISGITWSLLEGIGIWEDSQNLEFPGARRRLYVIQLAFERPGATTMVIRGEQEFFAAGRDTVLPDEGQVTVWTLRGQVDHSDIRSSKQTESCTWGSTKALYR